MKTAIALLLLAFSLPSQGWACISGSTTFYYYDGISFTAAFILPSTYFVAVEEEGREYDRVTYLDLSGYVKHGACEQVDYEPLNKYPTEGKVELKKSVSSVFLYSSPSCESVLSSVTAAESMFLYGDSETENVYYVRVTRADSVLRGYVSGEGVTVTYPSPNDTQAVAPGDPDEELPEITDNPPAKDTESGLAFPLEILLIVCLALPAFLLVFLLSRKKSK